MLLSRRMQPHPFYPQVVRAMQRIAPLSLADRSWDNVGTLLESPALPAAADKTQQQNKKNTVFLTIDLTPAVTAEAIRRNADVIVAYHPFIFSGLKSITLSDPKQAALMQLVQAGISVYCPHSALDACAGGINDWLIDIVLAAAKNNSNIAPQNIQRCPIQPNEEQPETVGVGRYCKITGGEGMKLSDVIAAVKQGAGIPTVRLAVPDERRGQPLDSFNIKSFAVCAGSGASVFRALRGPLSRPDLVVTGELGHHDVLGWTQKGTVVILCEHTNSERGYLKAGLAPRLLQQLAADGVNADGVEVIVSELDADPLVVA